MIDLRLGDCLDVMKTLPDNSVDMILCDLPYGTTACKWDSVIPFEPLWEQYRRITKPNAAIALFGCEPFSSKLRLSSIATYKYDWIWEKSHPTGFLNAWKQPLRKTELISVFYKQQPVYNPQIIDKPVGKIRIETGRHRKRTDVYGSYRVGDLTTKTLPNDKAMPTNILQFSGVNPAGKDKFHPTQKPVALMEYLIRTYTKEGETVLDNCMGSGTTGVACILTGRKFIGIEKDQAYFEAACERIKSAANDNTLQTSDLFKAAIA